MEFVEFWAMLSNKFIFDFYWFINCVTLLIWIIINKLYNLKWLNFMYVFYNEVYF